MTLSVFLKEHQSKLKLIKKLNVRDIDELEKNKFVAYVDENEKSYDVQLVLNDNKKIVEAACDCENGGTCLHIIALAQFLSGQKKEKTIVKKVSKRKLSENDQILETLNHDTLRIWVSELLAKNKEIAFLFKNQFGLNETLLDETTIKTTIKDCITSIVGKRKKVETNEVKKIIDALTVGLNPILEIVFSKISKENYSILRTIVNELHDFQYNYYSSSSRIDTFIKNLYKKQLQTLFNLKDLSEWQKSVDFYISLLFEEKIYMDDLHFCEAMYDFSKTNELQQKYICNSIDEKFTALLKNYTEKMSVFNFEVEQFFLHLFIENNLFEKHADKFFPRHYRNEYNLVLIENLLKTNNLILAEKYCTQQIAGNIKGEFDIPYVNLLILIYKKNNETQKLADLLSTYGKYLFDIEHYIFIKTYVEVEKFKKYRQAVLTNSRNSYQNGNSEAFDFYYEIKKLDGKTSDLLEMLRNCRNLEIVNKYKEIALKIDQIKFVKFISDYSSFYNQNIETIDSIADYVVSKIEKTTLLFYLKNFKSYYRNPIIDRIQSQLNH